MLPFVVNKDVHIHVHS